MKKKKSISEQLNPAILYLDDLETITSIITDYIEETPSKHASKEDPQRIHIATEDNIFDSLDDLNNLNVEKIHSLSIGTYWTELSLTLSNYSTSLYVSEDNNSARGSFEKIKKIINDRKDKFNVYKSSEGFLFTLYLISLITSLLAFLSKDFIGGSVALFFLILSLSLTFYGMSKSTKKYNTIYLKNKNEMPSFFKRNKEDFLKDSFKYVVGGVLGWLLSILIK